ncbi:DUF397 domain-containing protein [Streptosporangium longisporum]|uniref:DUF397 domain-containing protein n=1 Tax=Streptosporangium longisporum TaxID=46187 RepID=A0ABP6KJ51_9ACTN
MRSTADLEYCDVNESVDSLWRKSSWSDGQGACVAVANLGSHCAVKDTKDPHEACFVVSTNSWEAFVAAVKRGEFDNQVGRAARRRHVPPLRSLDS